ncbi:MAG: tetratricopeptide repeat protein [Terriglobales bacterium]
MNREAARFYALGVDKVRQFDALGAKDLLQQACIADPKFALGHMMLARAWHQLGYEQKRRHEAKQALDLSAHLPREDRLQVEGEYYESLPDHEKAASAYHALFELFPDDAEFGLELATSQKDAAHAGQAMETLHQLRQLPAPASDDPRIDLIELRAIPNNNPLALTMVQNAERKALAQAKRLLYAQARKEECMLHIYGEDPGLGPPACEEAYNIFMAVGNRLQAADALRLLADRQGGQGNSEAALATYKKALSLLQQLGETEKTGVVLNNMAIILTNEGKLDEAEQLYRQAKADFVRAGDKYAMTDALVNIADIYYERGNLGKAEQEYNQTLAAISQLENGAPGYAAMRLADVELARGQLLEAKNHAQQAVDSIHPPQGGQVYRSEAMVELGCILEAEANFEGARQLFQSAREIVEKLGQPDGVQEAQLAMASLALDERRPEQAEPLLRTAIAQFEKNKETPESASAYTELSRALLMEHRIDEAHDAIEHADELARTSPDPALKLPITIQTARVEMTEGGSHAADAQTFNRARRRLQSAAMTAKKLGYYLLECEARLALGELEMKTASPAAHSHLAALATETHSHGLELLAHQAEAIAANQQQLALNDQR